MLSRKLLTNRSRPFWTAFFILSPLAFLAAMILVARYDPVSRVGFAFNRGGFVTLASQAAEQRGIDVTGWNSLLKTGYDNSLFFYYRSHPGADLDRISATAPAAWVRGLLRSADGRESVQVTFTPSGKMTAFRRTLRPASDAKDAGEAATRTMAEAGLAQWLTPDEISRIGVPEIKEDRLPTSVSRRYTWKIPLENRPELNLSFATTVTNDQVTAQGFEGGLTEAFLKQFNLVGGFSLRVSGRTISGPAVVSLVLYYIAVAIVFVFGLYRFVQRARQRELSFQRIAMLTIIIAILFLSIILLTDVATFDNASQGGFIWPVYVFATLSYIFMGLIVAAGYGSGEGDLREAYPGKLTSLDALLTGRLFSRNVARSVLVGTAVASWGLLVANLIPLLWIRQPSVGNQLDMLDFVTGRLPWLSPLVIWPFDVVFTSITGLLLPLPFLRRRFRNHKVILVLVSVFAWIASTGTASTFTPWVGSAMIGAAWATMMLLAFFKFDLLTALVSLTVPTFAVAATHLITQPAASLRRDGLISLGIGFTFVLIEVYFSYRGRLLRDDEIGPQYAKFLAERLSMQAEVSAAREAQIRLLPQSLPQSKHFSIAAECRPAHEVGGDFYEVFSLDDDRIGVFMAEGGGKGLASALAIAFAKGFLMPKIASSGGDDSPTEVVRSLQSRLKQTLDADDRMGFAYAIIDHSDGTIRYARTGVSPRLVLAKGASGSDSPSFLPEVETRFTTPTRQPGDVAKNFSVISGMGDVAPGQFVLMFTDGISSVLADTDAGAAESLWKLLASSDVTDSKLQKSVHNAIESANKRAHKTGLTDDLTALVVRVNP